MPVTDNQEGLPLVNPGYSFNLSLPSAETGLVTPYPYTGDGYAQMLAERRAAEQREERMWRQRYAESAFDNAAKSPAGAVGAFQIMPITYKDYLERGKGKPGDLTNPAYNRKVRDFVLGIIPRDLGSLWSKESPEDINLAKRYAAYNWGAGSLRSYLRKKQKEGVDIHNSLDWMAGLPKETRDYVNFIVFNQDVPDTSKVADLYQAEREKYNSMAFGGVLGRFNHSDIRSALDKMRQKGSNKYDGDSEPTGKMHRSGAEKDTIPMSVNDKGELVDLLSPAIVTAKLPSKFNGSQAAANRYAEGYKFGKQIAKRRDAAIRGLMPNLDFLFMDESLPEYEKEKRMAEMIMRYSGGITHPIEALGMKVNPGRMLMTLNGFNMDSPVYSDEMLPKKYLDATEHSNYAGVGKDDYVGLDVPVSTARSAFQANDLTKAAENDFVSSFFNEEIPLENTDMIEQYDLLPFYKKLFGNHYPALFSSTPHVYQTYPDTLSVADKLNEIVNTTANYHPRSVTTDDYNERGPWYIHDNWPYFYDAGNNTRVDVELDGVKYSKDNDVFDVENVNRRAARPFTEFITRHGKPYIVSTPWYVSTPYFEKKENE